MKKYIATIGTVSHGTLNPVDLIPCFVELLEQLDNKNYTDLINEGKKIIESEDFESENASIFLNEDLFNALQDFAPNYCYFGNTESDWSDFGYWVYSDIAEDFEGLKVEDTSEIPDNYNGEVLHINDHGNVTLYSCVNGENTEIWSIV